MKYFSMIIVLSILVLICGCPQKESEDDGENEFRAVKAVIDSLYKAFDKADFEKFETSRNITKQAFEDF